MRSVEARGVIRPEKLGPKIDKLGLPPRLDKRLKRGGVWTIRALTVGVKEDFLPDGIGPDSIQKIQKALRRYAKQARERR